MNFLKQGVGKRMVNFFIVKKCVPRIFPNPLRYVVLLFVLTLLMLPHQLLAQTQDSRAGDEIALEALFVSTNGANWNKSLGWSSSGMSLSNDIHGVEVATIGGELRVTEIDLRDTGLTGSIDIPEIGNLKEMILFNVAYNSLDTNFPQHIVDCRSLRYLYLNYSDDQLGAPDLQPHVYIDSENPGHFEPGKDSGSRGDNIIRGRIPDDIDKLKNLEFFILQFADDWGLNNRTPRNINGIEYVPMSIWNISTLKVLEIYDCWNIAASGNTFSFPVSVAHISGMRQLYLGGGNGSTWDENEQGFMVGTYPDDIDQWTDLEVFSVGRNAQLTGFPDLSNARNLISIDLRETNLSGPLLSWPMDGTCPNMDAISLGNPSGEGLSGTLPTTWNVPHLDYVDVTYNNFTGAIPEGVWDIDPNKVNFGHNKFTSIGRTDLSHLVSMSTLRIYNNDIENERWPKLAWDKPQSELDAQWNQVRFEENRYVFADMLYVPDNAPNGETTFELYNRLDLTLFSYAPQKPAGRSNSYQVVSGNDITINDFDDTYSHPDNRYQWQKDGTNIPWATSRSLTITNVQPSDTGTYRLVVANPGVPDLTLRSEEITLTIYNN